MHGSVHHLLCVRFSAFSEIQKIESDGTIAMVCIHVSYVVQYLHQFGVCFVLVVVQYCTWYHTIVCDMVVMETV